MNINDPRYGMRSEDGKFWWDGEEWQTTDTQPFPTHADPNRKMNKAILIGVGVVLGGLVLVGIGGALAGGGVEEKGEPPATASSPKKATPPPTTEAPAPPVNTALECAEFFRYEVMPELQNGVALLEEGQAIMGTGDPYFAQTQAPGISRQWQANADAFAAMEDDAAEACNGTAIGPDMTASLTHLEASAQAWSDSWDAWSDLDTDAALAYAEKANAELAEANSHVQAVSDSLGL